MNSCLSGLAVHRPLDERTDGLTQARLFFVRNNILVQGEFLVRRRPSTINRLLHRTASYHTTYIFYRRDPLYLNEQKNTNALNTRTLLKNLWYLCLHTVHFFFSSSAVMMERGHVSLVVATVSVHLFYFFIINVYTSVK